MRIKKNLNQLSSIFIFSAIFVGLAAIMLSFFFFMEVQRVNEQVVSSWTQETKADCAVVLTGGQGRVSEGLSLLSQRRVNKLILSGVFSKANLRDIYPELVYYGEVDPKDIILEKQSKTTYGNALQTLTLVEAFQCRDLILITSRLHMYRSYKTFRSVFPEDFLIYKHATVGKSLEPSLLDLIEESIKSLFYSFWTY